VTARGTLVIEDMHSTPASNVGSASAEVPTLETDRLWLRPWSLTDADEYARILADPEVMRYMGSGLRYGAKRRIVSLVGVSGARARRTIGLLADHWRRHGFGAWAVEEKASGALIGQIGLVHHPDWIADPAKVEIGWMLALDAWGRGFATEGARASLAYAFEQLRMERIISISKPANRRSERVMQRLGLSFAGRTYWKDHEVIWYAIDRDTWERRARFGDLSGRA
jgi:RimJ/RimL family protein N-acetyltransferase